MSEEWIEHHGKGYPDLPMDTRVQVRFADGHEDDGSNPWRVYEWDVCWRHYPGYPHVADITHYRVVNSDE